MNNESDLAKEQNEELKQLFSTDAINNFEECYRKGLWITQDNRTIHISEMSLAHLRRALGYLRRGGKYYKSDLWYAKLFKEYESRL